MDTPIKGDSKDDRNKQEIPVKPDSKINIELTHEGKHHHRGHHRSHRWRKFKETATPLLIILGICFFVALLLTYMTGNLSSLIEKIVSKLFSRNHLCKGQTCRTNEADVDWY